MSQEIIQVDAFTAERFRGNPAALCILDEPADERWMQSLAAEMNLSETAYLRLDGDAYALRWFTPVAEVDLCGHATVAAAHILWEDGHVETSAECRFNTKSGLLVARRRDDWIEVDFPREEFAEIAAPEGLAEALGTAVGVHLKNHGMVFAGANLEMTTMDAIQVEYEAEITWRAMLIGDPETIPMLFLRGHWERRKAGEIFEPWEYFWKWVDQHPDSFRPRVYQT